MSDPILKPPITYCSRRTYLQCGPSTAKRWLCSLSMTPRSGSTAHVQNFWPRRLQYPPVRKGPGALSVRLPGKDCVEPIAAFMCIAQDGTLMDADIICH
jgi:hypothetical protein